MKQSGLRRMGIVVAICALVGALAGIAGSAAAPSKSSATKAQKKAKAQRQARRGAAKLFSGAPMGPGEGPVHSESVVPNAAGTGFETITTDGGTLTSVDANTLHIKEGTDKATYKADAAIDVGSNPTVMRNHAKAALSDLKPDDHVRVIQGGPQGTIVIAEDAATAVQDQKDHEGFRHHDGPPPPGAPAAPGSYPGDNDSGSSSSGSPAGGSSS